MAGHSRVKFNPVSREIEIEGSEMFVKTYFNRLQKLLAAEEAEPRERKTLKAVVAKKKKVKKNAAKKTAVKKTPQKPGKKAGKKVVTAMNRIVSALKGASAGLTTAQLKEKTGLKQRQIWTTIYRAQKLGKIARAKRGTYVAL